MANNQATVVLGARSDGLTRELSRSKSQIRSFAGSVQGMFRGIGRGVGGGLGILGAVGIGAGIRSALQFERSLTRLRINAEMTKGQMAQMRKSIRDISNETGVDPDQLLGAASKYQEKTGNLKAFIDMMPEITKVALGTGTAMQDAGLLAAELNRQLGIVGKGDVVSAFDVLQTHASAGAVELKDLAEQMAGVTPLFTKFGHTGVSGLRELSAILQVVEVGSKGVEGAVTNVQAAMAAIYKSQEKLKKAGIGLVDPKGRKKTISELMLEIYKKAEGDYGKIGKLIGNRGEGILAIQGLGSREAEFRKLERSQLSAGRAMNDYAKYHQDASGKIERGMAKIKNSINKTVAEHADSIASAITAIGKAVAWIADNAKVIAGVAILAKLIKLFLKLRSVAGGGPGFGGGGGGGGKYGWARELAGNAAGGAAAVGGRSWMTRLGSVARKAVPGPAMTGALALGSARHHGPGVEYRIQENARKAFNAGMQAAMNMDRSSEYGVVKPGYETVAERREWDKGYEAGVTMFGGMSRSTGKWKVGTFGRDAGGARGRAFQAGTTSAPGDMNEADRLAQERARKLHNLPDGPYLRAIRAGENGRILFPEDPAHPANKDLASGGAGQVPKVDVNVVIRFDDDGRLQAMLADRDDIRRRR